MAVPREQHIQSAEDLYEWFHMANNRGKNFKQTIKNMWDGIYVSSAVRREVLLSVDAGKITLDGTVKQIKFQDMKDGVWRAHIYTELQG